jgi:hypothetical protein
MTIEVRGEVAIRGTVEDVFDYLADPRNEPRSPGPESARMTGDGELRRGSTFVGTTSGQDALSCRSSNSCDRHASPSEHGRESSG